MRAVSLLKYKKRNQNVFFFLVWDDGLASMCPDAYRNGNRFSHKSICYVWLILVQS
jgi:hypothetical protein